MLLLSLVRPMRKFGIALAASVLVLAGCAPVQAPPAGNSARAAASEIPTITIKVVDGKLEVPADTPSGIVSFAVEGADPSNMPEIARINDGVTMDQFSEAINQPDPTAAVALVSLLGGGASADGKVIYRLLPGNYVAVLFAPDGPPVVSSFVAGAESGATPPTADVSADLVDFSFVLPDKIAAGPQVWQITNKGKQWHELGIVKLLEGTSVENVLKWVADTGPDGPSGPPPFEEGAFWSPMGPEQTAWVTWELPAGEYTVICFLPDLAGDMNSHAAHGMVRTLIVE